MVTSVTVVIVVAVLISVLWAGKRWNSRRRGMRAADLARGLDRAELEALDPKGDALYRIRDLGDEIDRVRGPEGARLRGRLALLEAEVAGDAGRRDLARQALDRFERVASEIPDGRELDVLRVRASTVALLATRMEDVTTAELEHGMHALERAPEIDEPEVLMRLVWAAHWMGRVWHRRGDWPQARALFEQASALARRIPPAGPEREDERWTTAARERFWTYGRRAGSIALLELADVSRTIGDRTHAHECYAQAVALLDGAATAEARLARARALLTCGLHDIGDEIAGPGGRLQLLEAAVTEASTAGGSSGFALAARAELELARLRESVGDAGRRVAHLARALACAKQAGAEGSALEVEANFTLGSHLEQQGAAADARAPFRLAYEQGHRHADLTVRWIAFLAGSSLHANLITHGEVESARTLLDGLTDLVPVLAPDARARAAARAARSRAQQLRYENLPREAEEAFVLAADLARRVDGADRGLLVFRIESDWGGMLAEGQRDSEAERHFSIAVETPDAMPMPSGSAERAEVLVQRAQVRFRLDRKRDAVEDLRSAFDLGRNGGTTHGREVAALAALVLGDAMRRQTDERRLHWETAARMGMLSGSERGRQVANAARLRMRGTEEA